MSTKTKRRPYICFTLPSGTKTVFRNTSDAAKHLLRLVQKASKPVREEATATFAKAVTESQRIDTDFSAFRLSFNPA